MNGNLHAYRIRGEKRQRGKKTPWWGSYGDIAETYGPECNLAPGSDPFPSIIIPVNIGVASRDRGIKPLSTPSLFWLCYGVSWPCRFHQTQTQIIGRIGGVNLIPWIRNDIGGTHCLESRQINTLYKTITLTNWDQTAQSPFSICTFSKTTAM